MAVITSYRVKYTCDLESELNAAWGEGSIAYCKQNGGKWWSVESGVWVEKTVENRVSASWADITGKPATFPPSAHTHDASYAAINHNHDANYSAANHNHNAAYSAINHNHDLTYSAIVHNHDASYSAIGHNHNAAYSAINHNHDANYSAIGHNHNANYEPINANIQTHIASQHAPSNAQKNSDILKAEIEAKLTGEISTHTHPTLQTSVLSADVTNSNASANTIANVTGLSFAVTQGVRYKFKFFIRYTAAATTTGSRWSINGPATTELIYRSQNSLTTASITTIEGSTSYDQPAASNAGSAATAGNIAVIEGIILPSSSGTVIARFASEVSSSAIVAKAGSYVEYQTI